jgi:hypothetical protein
MPSTSEVTEIANSSLPVEFQGYPRTDFEGWSRRFRQWCKETSTFYYARPHESFSQNEAYRLAAAAGCSRLLMEDMS